MPISKRVATLLWPRATTIRRVEKSLFAQGDKRGKKIVRYGSILEVVDPCTFNP